MQIIFHTTKGHFKVTLDQAAAPQTCENFIQYCRDGFYEKTLFHRVIPGFMAQCGGLESGMENKLTGQRSPIRNEAANGLKNVRGSLAMARTSDPHSATSQFFINVVDNDFLNFRNESLQGYGYCVFGQVSEGMEVIDAIVAAPTTSRRGHQDVPVDDILIDRVEIVE